MRFRKGTFWFESNGLEQFDLLLDQIKHGQRIAFRPPMWLVNDSADFDWFDLVQQLGPGPLPDIQPKEAMMLQCVYASEAARELFQNGISVRTCFQIASSERDLSGDKLANVMDSEQEVLAQRIRDRHAAWQRRRQAMKFDKGNIFSIAAATASWRSWADMSEDCAGWNLED